MRIWALGTGRLSQKKWREIEEDTKHFVMRTYTKTHTHTPPQTAVIKLKLLKKKKREREKLCSLELGRDSLR